MDNGLKLISLLRKCFTEDKISIFYRGNFDDSFTDKLISLAEYDVDKKAKKRIAFLMSESFQNIVRHGNGELNHTTHSVFGIRAVGPFLHIFSSNVVGENDKTFLEEKLDVINKLGKDELKAYYTRELEAGTISKKGGAGLGLIEMAKKSRNPLQKEFRTLDPATYAFNMQIDLIADDTSPALNDPMPIEENTSMYDLMEANDILFLYKGDFSDDAIGPMLNILEGNTRNIGDSIGYRIYHAAVELMQNVVRHGSSADKKEGVFSLNKTKTGYFLCTGNYTTKNTQLTEHVAKLNAMNKEELDEFYRLQLKASVALPDSSAGVGLIDLKRNFMTPLEIKMTDDKTGTYLTIGIEIPF